MVDLIQYLKEAMYRADSGDLDSSEGSHLQGVFCKAATLFEREFREKLEKALSDAGINYDKQIREHIPTRRDFTKLTLGELISVSGEGSELRDSNKSSIVFDSGLRDTMKKINRVWVLVKHGKEPSRAALVEGLKNMHQAITDIRKSTS